MSNKYIYISSKGQGNSNHADFEVALPEIMDIKPYSQVRCISCRVRPPDNAIVINKDNNIFYIGTDYWSKENSSVPLLPVILYKDAFDLKQGINENDFNTELDRAINEALENYCFARGGIETTIDANHNLTFKLSTMEMYGCPEQSLTNEVYDFLWDQNLNDLDRAGEIYQPLVDTPAQLDHMADYYGLILNKPIGNKFYYISPPVVGGLMNYNIEEVDKDIDDAPINAIFEINLNGVTLANNDFIIITSGFCDSADFMIGGSPYEWGPDANVYSTTHRFSITINNIGLTIFCNGAMYRTTGFIYTNTSEYKIIVREYEDTRSSYFIIEIQHTSDGGATWTDINIQNGPNNDGIFRKNINTLKQTITNKSIRGGNERYLNYGIVAEITPTDAIDIIKCTFAADDHNNEYGWNMDTLEYGERAKLNLNQNRPFSIVSDINAIGTSVDIDAEMIYDFNNAIKQPNVDDILVTSYALPSQYLPNASEYGFDDDGLDMNVWNDDIYATWTTGIILNDPVITNSRAFPQMYLSIPTLPLENYTSNPLDGKKVSFVCPIDLNPSATHNRLYTSQLYTECYNNMTNSYNLRLNNFRVRICDIDGTVVKGLDPYTIITLEIRENPELKQLEYLEKLKGTFEQISYNASGIKLSKTGQ